MTHADPDPDSPLLAAVEVDAPMMLLPCPWCGPRNVTEFRYAGERHERPDPNATTLAEWRRYLYTKANPSGPVAENWYHRAGCRKYFSVERDTATNTVLGTEKAR